MKNDMNIYIDAKEVSKETGIPMMRIANQIFNGDLNGIVIDKENILIQKSELPYIK